MLLNECLLALILFATINGAFIFPMTLNCWTRNVYINITVVGFNDGEPLTLRVDCHRNLVIESRLFDGVYDVNSDSASITAIDGRAMEIEGYLVQHSTWIEEGYLGIGPGSVVIRQHGPIDLIYSPYMDTRLLVVNSSEVYPQSCVPNSTISIPFVYIDSWAHNVIPYVTFKLMRHSDTHDRGVFLNEQLPPYSLSVNGFASYMCLPGTIAETLSNMISSQGAVWVLSDDLNVPISFNQCTAAIINSLPDIVIVITGDTNNTLGEVIQTPSDYLRIDPLNDECAFRFITAYEDEIYSINPFTLNGINVRVDENQLHICDSIHS